MLKHLPAAAVSALLATNRLPQRTFGEEVMCRALKRLIVKGQGKGINHMRSQMESLGARSPGLKRCSYENQSVVGINCTVTKPIQSPDKAIDGEKIILYLHGGGYISGSPSSYKALVADIADNTSCEVITPDYRLAPEAPFPAPQDDCMAVALALAEKYKDRKMVIAGDSAGGALAVATTQSLLQQGAPVTGVVLISPWVNPSAKGGSIDTNAEHDFLLGGFLDKSFQALMQGQDVNDPRVNFASSDLSNLPDTLVHYGTGELFYDQIDTFVADLKAQGVSVNAQAYADQCHDFQFFTSVSQTARNALSEIGKFVTSL